nr:MAG: Hom-end-associated Hint [Bacteriophage sp.]
MGFELRPYQKEAVDAGLKFLTGRSKKPGIIVAPCGCHAKGYGILMYDGTIKKVEDIVVGDRVMGDDGTPRTVLELHNGIDDMYEIRPLKGKPFIVNKGHIMSMYRLKDKRKDGPSIEEVSIGEYIKFAPYHKTILKLRRPNGFDFEESKKNMPLDPYFLGLCLGDGSITSSLSITTQRQEIVEYLYSFVKQYNMYIRVAEKKGTNNKSKSYFLSKGCRRGGNPIINAIKDIGLYNRKSGDKFIPIQYLTSNKENRYKLLAGFLDTDAYYNKSGKGYEYCSKSETMMKQFVLLCRSLGLLCSGYSCKLVDGVKYYRTGIYGNLENIPVRVGIRKGANRIINKNPYVVGFKVEYVGKGEYYGFTTDGNHLYLDEQCFIHHNSGKSLIISKIAHEINRPTLVLQPSKEILEQNYAKAVSFGSKPTIYSASCGIKELSAMTYATLKSIKKDVARLKDIGIDTLLIDECHSGYSPEEGSEFMEFMNGFPEAKVLGFTATPCRLRTYSSMLEGNYSKLNMLTKDEHNFFKKIVHVTQIQELTSQGFWCPLKYERWSFDESALMLNSTGAEYTNESIKESIVRNGLNNSIYKRLLQLMNERKAIFVCMDSIESCNRISEFMNARMGAITGVVTSLTTKKKREQIISDFKEGKLKVVFNYSTLATGFDFPELDCVMFGRPTFSYSVFYQIVGRAVRIHPDKKEALIVDCCDNMRRFGRIEDLTIEQFPSKGWCMFAGDQLLSNIRMGDIITKDEILRRAASLKSVNGDGRREDDLDSIIMWFGKYEGIRFKDIPVSYFRFLAENMAVKPGDRKEKIIEYYNRIKA